MTAPFRFCLAMAPTLFLALPTMAGGPSVTHLRCEYLENALGIDTPQPRLSWIVESKERGQRQTAFQILLDVAKADPDATKPALWDSGKVESDENIGVPYAGKPLLSSQRCYWKVRVWDKDGKASEWSQPAFFEMGLLKATDWKGQWIARTTDTNSNPAPLLRRAFTLKGKIKQARAYLCGLGYYELHINGKNIGDHLLDPAFTRYDKRVLYVTYDVTEALKRGKNTIGVILGNGWYNVHTKAVWDFHNASWRAAPKLLMQLAVEYEDGSNEVIATDAQWKTSTGPVVFDSIYSGETYDARLEKPGWDTPAYDDSDWNAAEVVEAPKGTLRAQMMEPIKVDRIIKPVKLTEPQPGVFVFDMGQNFAGFAELSARGPAGTKIVMKYSERLGTNGMIDRAEIQKHVLKLDTNQQFQTDTYILKGKGRENWHSRFAYHGFQYVEVTGFPGKPTLDSLRGVFIHSAVPIAGEFECSNPLLNKIWRASRWSFLSNLQGIPTDCPHREKNGWTGDAHLAAEQGLFSYSPAAVYTKWINDLGDEQQPGGELPGIVPTSGWGYKWGNGPAWDSAFLLIPYYLYEYCGDTRILSEHYEGMKRYVDYLTSKTKDGIVSIGLNDWAPFETKTPADITSTAYYYRDAQIVALAAECQSETLFAWFAHFFADPRSLQATSTPITPEESLTNRLVWEAVRYRDLAEDVRKAFNKRFYNRETGVYGNGSQTALSCALYQGLVEERDKARVVSNLVAAIEKRNDHIDTGILGAKYLMNALLENGQVDLAYRIATQTNQPGWGWWMEQGATTLWEEWNGEGSRNHIMFGDISAWFYRALAGINPDAAAPGFKHFIIKPNVVGDLTYAKASYDSIRGRIVSDWKIVDGRFHLALTIPANATATIYLPAKYSSAVKERGKSLDKAEGVKVLGTKSGSASLEVGAGAYHFEAGKGAWMSR